MPTLGDIVKGSEIGRDKNAQFIWVTCLDCGKERWVSKYDKDRSLRCRECAIKSPEYRNRLAMSARSRTREKHPRWVDGIKHNQGYRMVTIYSGDFFLPMADKHGRVFEHRLVVAKSLGRCLLPWEVVHHKNGVREDNHIENLELSMKGAHTVMHSKGYKDGYLKGLYDGHEARIKKLESRITLLEAENALLKVESI